MATKDLLQLFCNTLALPSNGTKIILQNRICDKLCNNSSSIKIITKDLLQLFCKTLKLDTIGTKSILQERICKKLCNKPISNESNNTKIITILNMIKNKQHDKVFLILKDVLDMYDDDVSIDSILKNIIKLHNVKVNKNDILIFIELVDALRKKDQEYVEEKLQEWDKKAKNGIMFVKMYAKEQKLNWKL